MKFVCCCLLLFNVHIATNRILADEAMFFFPKEGEPILSLVLPESWKGEWQRNNGDDIFVAIHTLDRGLSLRFAVVPGIAGFDDLPAQLPAVLERFVIGPDADDESWQSGVFDETPIMYVEARGKDKRTGKATACFVSFLKPPEEPLILMLISGSDDALARYKGNVNYLIDNIQVQHTVSVSPPENNDIGNEGLNDNLPLL